jgi:molybdopterin-guanine dinucleotide biosynthesis protein
MPRVIKSRILEAGGTRSGDRRLVQRICKHVAAFVAGDPQAGQQLETLLESYKLSVDFIIATAFDDRIVSQVHIGRMTTMAWERRVAAYAELDRLRTLSGKLEAPWDAVLEIGHEGPPTAPVDGGGGR